MLADLAIIHPEATPTSGPAEDAYLLAARQARSHRERAALLAAVGSTKDVERCASGNPSVGLPKEGQRLRSEEWEIAQAPCATRLG